MDDWKYGLTGLELFFIVSLTHYQTTNLDYFKLKEFADDNFKFDENGRKLSKQVENTLGKGEIACYEQFLLFPQCYQKACFPGASKGGIVWEWVNCTYLPWKLFLIACNSASILVHSNPHNSENVISDPSVHQY